MPDVAVPVVAFVATIPTENAAAAVAATVDGAVVAVAGDEWQRVDVGVDAGAIDSREAVDDVLVDCPAVAFETVNGKTFDQLMDGCRLQMAELHITHLLRMRLNAWRTSLLPHSGRRLTGHARRYAPTFPGWTVGLYAVVVAVIVGIRTTCSTTRVGMIVISIVTVVAAVVGVVVWAVRWTWCLIITITIAIITIIAIYILIIVAVVMMVILLLWTDDSIVISVSFYHST